MLIAGRQVDDALLKAAFARGRETGRAFSYEQLVTRALALGGKVDGRTLTRAVDSFTPSRLPPQQGLRAPPTIQAAATFGWHAVEAEAEQVPTAEVPHGFGRVIVESQGAVASPDEQIISAYLPERAEGKLAPLKQRNTVYFGVTSVGQADRFFGPFELDRKGIPLAGGLAGEALPPPVTARSLLDLGSQKQVRALTLPKLVDQALRFDLMTDGDARAYESLSKETMARLTALQAKQVAELTSYEGPRGNVAPVINEALRSGSTAYGAERALLDGAIARATTLPEGLRLFRGAALLGSELKRGATLVDPGYAFTTLEPSMALRFARQGAAAGRVPVVLVIDIEAPVQGLVSGNTGESEVLLRRELPLVVQRIERRDGVAFVTVKATAP
ncbi:MAG: hypothetical protein K1X89_09535 [Myxococcaceae bacterium]|nr:hypothetical protein [Myxococcaceae bacterium]